MDEAALFYDPLGAVVCFIVTNQMASGSNFSCTRHAFLKSFLFKRKISRQLLPVLFRFHPTLNVGLDHADGPGIADGNNVNSFGVLNRLHFGLAVQDIQETAFVIREV